MATATLTKRQKECFDWLIDFGPAFKSDWTAAGFTHNTVWSLVDRGVADYENVISRGVNSFRFFAALNTDKEG